ncbi:hypothetical protein HD554DRAFT_2310811 [Boletus coccyginus]|nr:hypothetical protein HD554DRAFT_2310811 [Boletus coccyginus]
MTSTTMSSQNNPDVVPPAGTEQQRVQAPPSSLAGPPTGTGNPPQQASFPPGNGNEVRAEQIKKPSEVNRDDPNINVVELPPHNPTFKEQAYGYAKVIRGTVLGQSDVKERGAKVLRGEEGIPQRRGSQ